MFAQSGLVFVLDKEEELFGGEEYQELWRTESNSQVAVCFPFYDFPDQKVSLLIRFIIIIIIQIAQYSHSHPDHPAGLFNSPTQLNRATHSA